MSDRADHAAVEPFSPLRAVPAHGLSAQSHGRGYQRRVVGKYGNTGSPISWPGATFSGVGLFLRPPCTLRGARRLVLVAGVEVLDQRWVAACTSFDEALFIDIADRGGWNHAAQATMCFGAALRLTTELGRSKGRLWN
jgi:hypothetical protein